MVMSCGYGSLVFIKLHLCNSLQTEELDGAETFQRQVTVEAGAKLPFVRQGGTTLSIHSARSGISFSGSIQ